MYDIILAFLTAFMITYFAIPSIIGIAKIKDLVDRPDDRKSHANATPSLGGIAIFAGMIFSIIFWTPFSVFGDLQYILCAFIIIFLFGAKDDIVPLDPWKKIFGEILAAGILVYKSNVKLSSLYGIFGVYTLPEWFAIPFSIFVILVIINAFNLIDGINGLSGSIALLIAASLGSWFYLVNHIELCMVAFAMSGAILAFLKYNFTPAKIFMGDTGSLLLGLVCAILSIKFIELHNEAIDQPYRLQSVPAVAIGILILPLFDTFRVFVLRISKGKSPLSADRNHIHHLLLDAGCSHMQATAILIVVNILFIALALTFQGIGSLNLLLLIILLASLLTGILWMLKNRNQQKLV